MASLSSAPVTFSSPLAERSEGTLDLLRASVEVHVIAFDELVKELTAA